MAALGRRMALLLVAGAGLAAGGTARAQAELTPAEHEWLAASEPVLAYGLRHGLPLDLVLQPQPRAGDPPLGLAFVEGRCKFVLSLRGHPQADAGLGEAAPADRALLIETMAAHEMAHCWRHVRGGWQRLPAALVADDEVRAQRREEGYADLAALAWVRERHPSRYAQVLDWLSALRDPPPYAGSAHDTGAWLRLARQRPAALDGPDEVFARVAPLWSAGLRETSSD